MKRCKKLEKIKKEIKTEFPGVVLHQNKAIIFFDLNEFIKIYLHIKTWESYDLVITYVTAKFSQMYTIARIDDIKNLINNFLQEDEVF